MAEEYDSYFELLSVPQQQAIARGDTSLEALLERITSGVGAELCPRCARAAVSHAHLGLCSVCARQAMTEAFEATISELEAQREANRLKKQVQRLRDDVDPARLRRKLPKRATDYGLLHLVTTGWPLMVQCVSCGRSFPPHGDNAICPSCLEREERKENRAISP